VAAFVLLEIVNGASYALSLGLADGDVFSFVIAFSPGFIVRARARGSIGNNNEIQVPLVYIAHGVGHNVLPIGSTSRVFVSSLRKTGTKWSSANSAEAIMFRAKLSISR
jgi:phospholipase/carboxylesterase